MVCSRYTTKDRGVNGQITKAQSIILCQARVVHRQLSPMIQEIEDKERRMENGNSQ